ncbi:O-antigen/teichoic acid export membrane protein [Neobacillus niacini]|uniref:lipopolysaccharide biosynthesis protein n=1 Tax=Neobacillus driksii TaxID=3035913 RepID=UPI002787B665|nr:oligosaccharide flippase family protein [Neobacillus niacini]MDQ0975380.1 O-antigen/teichoic acid export membrane protein [Neobacillus niacini]
MRTKNSLKNILVSITSQVIIALLGFISRKIFLDSLGPQYLGVNGLLTNVLAMLALVESGIGTSIIFSLYKPLAENDKPKIIALIQLYKKAYFIIAIFILILSIVLFPFLGYLIKDSESIPYLATAYFIFVSKNFITYLNAHKLSLINADQKGYVISSINLTFQVISTIAKIIVLILTKNYVLYLLIELSLYLIQVLFIGKVVDKRYSYIKTREKHSIDEYEKKSIITKIKALLLHNIGGYALNGTDNILISTFVGIVTVGIYSNYSMIIGQLSLLLAPVFNGIGASVGNLIATEDNDKKYSVFKVVFLINFWIYSIGAIVLYILLNPFIIWWLGEEYLLDSLTVIIILVNFYISGLRTAIFTFKVKGGIFVEDKYMPLIGATVNLGSSILLAKYMGVSGIFLGTTISILVVFWKAPRLVYKNIFNKPIHLYIKCYLFYIALTLFTGLICVEICNLILIKGTFLALVAKGFTCLLIINIIYILVFYKTKEFQYLKNIVGVLSLNQSKFSSSKGV